MRRLGLVVLCAAFVGGCGSPTPAPTAKGGPTLHDPAFWDATAEAYVAKAHPFTLLYAKAMLGRLEVGPGVRYLDVATGTGAAALPAADLGAEVVAIDFSEGMVRRLKARGVRGIDARVMDGQALDLPDASFDVTVSVFGVMLFPDWNKGLREMARVTKPGGTAAVVTWRDPAGGGINQAVGTVARELFPDIELPPPAAGMVELSDPARLAAAMTAAGFEPPVVEVIRETHTFKVEQLFVGNPWSLRLDAAQQKAVSDEVRRRYGRDRDGDDLFVESEAVLAVAKRR
jgi:ubiquinone/menaquinone biosynthesis C-methylase UbiE